MHGLNAVAGAVAMHLSLVSAVNSVNFINNCPYDVWYWVVGPKGSLLDGFDHQRNLVPRNAGSTVHGVVNTEYLGAGIALKLRDLPYYAVAPAGIIQVEYHLEPSRNAFWYDLSAIDCNHALGPESPSFCPLVGGGIKIYVKGHAWDNCPDAWCKEGTCYNAYTEHGSWWNEPSFKCTAGVDLFVEMCTERAGPRTKDKKGGMVPGPYSQPALESLAISPDGTCGGSTGHTCEGGQWGECCSQYGYCGSSTGFCDANCQTWFGVCSGKDYDTVPSSPALSPYYKPFPVEPIPTLLGPHYGSSKISPNGLCGPDTGFTCANSVFGSCCSKYKHCGDTALHCGEGCHYGFGTCHGIYGRDTTTTLVTSTITQTKKSKFTLPFQRHSSFSSKSGGIAITKSV